MTEVKEQAIVSPVVLCFSGYDPSGGAGILADARSCAAFSAFAVGVQTGLVVQNTTGVRATFPSTQEHIQSQFEALDDDLRFSAVKIGLVPTIDAVYSIARCLEVLRKRRSDLPVVIDPVFVPSNGKKWGGEKLFEAIQQELFRFATVVTPNAPEAEFLVGSKIEDLDAMLAAAKQIQQRSGAKNVLIKGGHLAQLTGERRGDQSEKLAIDIFFDGIRETHFRAKFLEDSAVRGTGCMLASAIAAQMAHGMSAVDAARLGKTWLFERIKNAQIQGGGQKVAVF